MICVVVCTNVVDLVLVIVAFFVCMCVFVSAVVVSVAVLAWCPRASAIVDVVDVVA